MSQFDGADAVIIGAGVTGLAAAWFLARAGVDTIVVEKGVVGYEASSRNGGICAYHRGVEPNGPMGYEETRLWHTLEEELGYPCEFIRGTVIVAMNDEEMEDVAIDSKRTNPMGWNTEVLDSDMLRKWVPILSPEVRGGLYDPDAGHANPQRTVQAFAWAFTDLGGRIYQHTQATGFQVEAGKVLSVETNRGSIGCNVVVSAAGPQVGVLADMVGGFVPVSPGRVEIIVTTPVERMWEGALMGNGLYGRQTERGNLAYGGGNQEWVDVDNDTPERLNTPLIRNIGRRLMEMFPGAGDFGILRSWSCVVEQSPDMYPIIDFLPEVSNYIVATASADGFGLAPAHGKAIAELVQHGETSLPVENYALGRFADVGRGWREEYGWAAAPERVSTSATQPVS